jgi:CHAD domain-containing protein
MHELRPGRSGMAHRIGRRENPAEGLIRLLRADLNGAMRDLRGGGRREERIHRTRQRLKRARTILRVLEPAFGHPAVLARRSLTEAAQLLARARDADVAAASARDLAVASPADIGFDRIAANLDREAELAHAERTPLGAVSLKFAAANAAIAAFSADFDGERLLAAALAGGYAKGRRAMRQAQATLATPDLHRWRKAVKALGHLVVLTRSRLPTKARKLARRLETLGDILGRDNDHAMLAERIALSPVGDPSLMSQLDVIAKRRHALEAEAFAIGSRIYGHKPKKFARSLGLR